MKYETAIALQMVIEANIGTSRFSIDEINKMVEDNKSDAYFYEDAPESFELAKNIASLVNTESLNVINNEGIFNIAHDERDDYVEIKLVGVVSKANYKALANIAKGARINYNTLTVNFLHIEELLKIIKKSTKLSQETLKTILTCRLEGLYKGKHADGKTWNQGGIDKA